MKKILTASMKMLGLAVVLLGQRAAAEPQKLITSASQFITDCSDAAYANQLGNLLDGDVWTEWRSDTRGTYNGEHYLIIDLGENFSLADDEDLVFYTQRHSDHQLIGNQNTNLAAECPTTFELEAADSPDGPFTGFGLDANGRPHHTHFFFLMRGFQTKEYSARLHTKRSFRYLKVTLKANNSKTFNSNGYRRMTMAEFNVYKLKRTDTYPDGRFDRVHMTDDYFDGYRSHRFVNTQGPLDQRNRTGSNSGLQTWTDWSGFNADGQWTRDTATLNAAGIRMPDMSFITPANDTTGRVIQGVRQRTHTTEHTVYAIPGDVVALYPYYQLGLINNYQENFSHWYDWRTGGHLVDDSGHHILDFLIDPTRVGYTDGYGYIAGRELPKRNIMAESEIMTIATPQDFIEFGRRVSAGEYGLHARVTADLDFSGLTVEPVGFGNVNANDPWTAARNYGYRGVFDGGGHVISNLVMNYPGKDCVALFAMTSGATIGNLVVDASCSFTGRRFTATFVGIEPSGSAGDLTLTGLLSHATVAGKGINASGIFGTKQNGGNTTVVKMIDCASTGPVSGTGESAQACAFAGKKASVFSGSWSTSTLKGGDGNGNTFYRITNTCEKPVVTNCFSSLGGNGLPKPPAALNTPEFVAMLGGGWEVSPSGDYPRPRYRELPHYSTETFDNTSLSEYAPGSTATFFYPRDPYTDDGELLSLPHDYYIAADFSQSFDRNVNIADSGDGGEIVEPVIAFRHIFHVKDGKAFADEFSATKANNDEYVKKNRRYLSAPAANAFQIRLDSPVPKPGTGVRSIYYYKISNSDYRRVCSSRIRAFEKGTGRDVSSMFYLAEEASGKGYRTIDGVRYYIHAGDQGKMYRMIRCDKPVEGTYVVELIGLDYNDQEIVIPDGSGAKLIVQEFEVTFLPESRAFMVPDNEFRNSRYDHGRVDYLKHICGEPAAVIDFDEYRDLPDSRTYTAVSTQAARARMYKFPVAWDQSAYAYGYNERHDYNMYLLAQHASLTPYHDAANDDIPASDNFDEGTGGLFDRRFYDTGGRELGYFYYVNAATDPGVMARLNVTGLCNGSTLFVSAWLAEFSKNNEVANLTFNFIAVTKSGERVPLHSFTTGYVDRATLGRWHKIYYSFVPDFADKDITTNDVDHYELELDNNCKSSSGADYAIDDIRVYVLHPVVYSHQPMPLCNASDRAIDVRVEAPFSVLLQSMGLRESLTEKGAVTTNLYYTFVDKKKYEEVLAATDDYTAAFDSAQLVYPYDPKVANPDQKWARLTFSNHYASNPDYQYGRYGEHRELFNVAMKDTVEDERTIVFNTHPLHDGLRAGKEYIIALYTSEGEIDANDAVDFDIASPCAKTCSFIVQTMSNIKVDGLVMSDISDLEVCANQQPVIQVNLYGRPADDPEGECVLIEDDAYLDWYAGTVEEFLAERNESGLYLCDALSGFRALYPTLSNPDQPTDETYTAAMRLMLMDYTRAHDDEAPRLYLHQSSFIFPPVTNTLLARSNEVSVTAIPIDYFNERYQICAEPSEVRMHVTRRAPLMLTGFREIDYPDYYTEVPVRIGLEHLDSITAESSELRAESTSAHGSPKVSQPSALSSQLSLNIPLRRVASHLATGGNSVVSEMRITDPSLFLAETNDPEYRRLGISDTESEGLHAIGTVSELKAVVDGDDNILRLQFDPDFRFKEGYYYRLLFDYSEKLPNDMELDEEPCAGVQIVTLKIVPRYAAWTAATRYRNWNNDHNWRRVSSAELYFPADTASRFVTDGLDSNTYAYAPLDYTHVLIPPRAPSATLNSQLSTLNLPRTTPGCTHPIPRNFIRSTSPTTA